MSYYFKVLKKYAGFSGRARRKEYWMFCLVNAIIATVISTIAGIIGSIINVDLRIIQSLYSLAVFFPSLAVGIRRMHDIDKSGWYILIPIYDIVLACTEGTKGQNKYGLDPKEND